MTEIVDFSNFKSKKEAEQYNIISTEEFETFHKVLNAMREGAVTEHNTVTIRIRPDEIEISTMIYETGLDDFDGPIQPGMMVLGSTNTLDCKIPFPKTPDADFIGNMISAVEFIAEYPKDDVEG